MLGGSIFCGVKREEGRLPLFRDLFVLRVENQLQKRAIRYYKCGRRGGGRDLSVVGAGFCSDWNSKFQ